MAVEAGDSSLRYLTSVHPCQELSSPGWPALPGPSPSALSPDTVLFQEQRSRGARSSGPQRPHSFSEALRRPASMGSDGLPGETDPSKGSPTASAPCMPPPSHHSFRPLDLTQAFCPSVSLPLPVVKRKPWTSLSSESVSCPQGSLSPTASLIQVSSQWVGLLPPQSPDSFWLSSALGQEARGPPEHIRSTELLTSALEALRAICNSWLSSP